MLFLRDEYGMPVARICPGKTERNQGPVYPRPRRTRNRLGTPSVNLIGQPGFGGAFPLLTLTDGAVFLPGVPLGCLGMIRHRKKLGENSLFYLSFITTWAARHL